jgi:hypothetical protein
MKCFLLMIFVGLTAACAECKPQQHRHCQCANARPGEQFCTADGVYGACICTLGPGSDASVAVD